MNAIIDNEIKKVETEAKTIWQEIEAWYERHFHSQGRHITPEAKRDLEGIVAKTQAPIVSANATLPDTVTVSGGELSPLPESSGQSEGNSTISGAV